MSGGLASAAQARRSFERGGRPDDVVVVGVGACTAAGRTAASVAAAARAGIRGWTRHPRWTDAREQPRVVAAAPWLKAGAARASRLARRAITEALEPVARSSGGRLPIALPVWWGDDPDGASVELRRSWWRSSLEPVARRPTLGDLVPALAALEAVAREERPWALWGGASSAVEEGRVERLAAQEALWPEHPRGEVVGEGAAAMLVGRRSFCAGLGLSPLARVLAAASGEAWRRALHDHAVEAVVTDYGGGEHGLEMHHRCVEGLDVPVYTPARTWGIVGPAVGPLAVAVAMQLPVARVAIVSTRGPHVLVIARG